MRVEPLLAHGSPDVGTSVPQGELMFPILVARVSALRNNARVMADYASANGFELCPHAKVALAPDLMRLQLAEGAWGITVANACQAEVAAHAGACRVLIANEVVGLHDTRQIAQLSRSGIAVSCLVDSVRGVELLDRNLRAAGLDGRIGVLVELGVPGGRAGARSIAQALEVVDSVEGSSRLTLAGVEGYEGGLASDRSREGLHRIDAYLADLGALAAAVLRRVGSERDGFMVTAGGSKYFDRVAAMLGGADRPYRLVVRAGCYLLHDHGVYRDVSPFAAEGASRRLEPALEVWAEVLSTPEEGLAIVAMGRRDVSFDSGMPVPLHRVQGGDVCPIADASVEKLDDQHAYVHFGPSDHLNPGDRVGFGISHPCTAVDRWRSIALVDDNYVVETMIETVFH